MNSDQTLNRAANALKHGRLHVRQNQKLSGDRLLTFANARAAGDPVERIRILSVPWYSYDFLEGGTWLPSEPGTRVACDVHKARHIITSAAKALGRAEDPDAEDQNQLVTGLTLLLAHENVRELWTSRELQALQWCRTQFVGRKAFTWSQGRRDEWEARKALAGVEESNRPDPSPVDLDSPAALATPKPQARIASKESAAKARKLAAGESAILQRAKINAEDRAAGRPLSSISQIEGIGPWAPLPEEFEHETVAQVVARRREEFKAAQLASEPARRMHEELVESIVMTYPDDADPLEVRIAVEEHLARRKDRDAEDPILEQRRIRLMGGGFEHLPKPTVAEKDAYNAYTFKIPDFTVPIDLEEWLALPPEQRPTAENPGGPPVDLDDI